MPRSSDPEDYGFLLAPLGAAAIVASILLADALGVFLAILGVSLLAFACYSARDGFLLLGPYPRLELLRAVRKQRLHLWWGILAGITAVGIIVGYGFVAFGDYPHHQVAYVSTLVALFMIWNLFLVVISVTLTVMSSAIAEDRDGKRLDFVLASDLRSREIVVGKLMGCLLVSFSLPFALLPLVIVLPLLFGIDPTILVYLAAFSLVSILSLCGLALLSSAMAATKKAGGTTLTLFVLPYILLTFGLEYIRSTFPAVWFFPGTPNRVPSVIFGDVADLICAGNPVLIIQKWVSGSFASAADGFQTYAAMHVGFFFTGLLLAIALLRPQSAKLADQVTDVGVDASAVPPVSERPVMWKERYFTLSQVQARRRRIVRIIGILVVAPAVLFVASRFSDMLGYAAGVRDLSRFYVPLLVWIFSVAGSRIGLESIVRERDKDTLTSLLLTDYTPRQIITEKLHGILRVFRPGWIAVTVIAATSVVSGGMLWWTALAAVILLVVFSTFLIVLGLHTSASATSLEACSKTFGLKIIPFVFAPPLCIIGMIMAPMVSVESQLIGTGVVTGIVLIYIGIGRLYWKSAVKRFERACDPAREEPLR